MKRVLVCLMLLAVGFVVQAQTDDWPPDPDAIFAEGVQWMPYAEPEQPFRPIQTDNEQKIIRVYNESSDTWQEFPYPDALSHVTSAYLQSDGLIRVYYADYSTSNVPIPQNTFLLNPITGIYEPAPTVCEGGILQAEPRKAGEWKIAYSPDIEGRDWLCHTETGEIRDILPEDFIDGRIFTSPDGDYLLITSLNFAEGYRIYSYQIETDQLIQLGIINRGIDSVPAVCEWFSNTRGLICNSDAYRYWPGTSYYAFDISQEDSMEYVFGGWNENIVRLEDPLRYIIVDSQDFSAFWLGSVSPEHWPCQLTIYDGEQRITEELGYECTPIAFDMGDIAPFYHHDQTLYYLTVDSADSTVSTLRSFDITTLEISDMLWMGEIESILSVSPDGRYVVFLMDNNGELDFPWREGITPYRGWLFTILDRDNGRIVYQSEPIGVSIVGQIAWLNEQTIVIGTYKAITWLRATEDGDGMSMSRPPSLRRITFLEDGAMDIVTTTRYKPDYDAWSPDYQYTLLDEHGVIDLRTFEYIPLLQDDVEERYKVNIRWLDDGDLLVDIDEKESRESVQYRVTLPG